jgi:hypothetical protein
MISEGSSDAGFEVKRSMCQVYTQLGALEQHEATLGEYAALRVTVW